jgi:hypothetical protein
LHSCSKFAMPMTGILLTKFLAEEGNGVNKKDVITETFKQGAGILKLLPNFVPRNFSKPGYRLRLHPDDYFALGMNRGAFKERWFSSIITAQNGPLSAPDEGLSYVAVTDEIKDKLLFKDFIDILGAAIIGDELYRRYGTWPMFAKFFDYNEPLFFHLHLMQSSADLVGKLSKPEAYYFPPQLNNHLGTAPYIYFGFDVSVTKEEVRDKVIKYLQCDTRITLLSRAYRIELGTGWYTPPGVIHAPGSVLTYEPQWNSDCNAVFENVTAGEINAYEALVENCPEEKKHDVDYIMSLLDWEKNVDPNYRLTYYRPPITCATSNAQVIEKWICYANDYICAKELTVMPGQEITSVDQAAYGAVVVQGHGKFGVYDTEAATMIRFGQITADEFFVSNAAAREGVRIINLSRYEPLVLLKHFGPDNPEMPKTVKS